MSERSLATLAEKLFELPDFSLRRMDVMELNARLAVDRRKKREDRSSS